MNAYRTLAAATLAAACALAVAETDAQPLAYPPAAKKNVSDTFFDVTVTEEYRWLEDGKDPAVRQWSVDQLKVARGYLDALPQRAALKQRFADLYRGAAVRYNNFEQSAGGFFAMKRQPPKNQPMLVMMKAAGDTASEKVLVDPNAINAKGTTAIDWYEPSLDGRYVAVAMSEGGSEDGSAHVYDTATGKALDDVVPRVQYPTGAGSIAWDAKGTGFWYTRYPQGSERAPADVNFYQQVWYHKLGTPPSADTYAMGKDLPRIAETHLTASRDGKYVLAAVRNGDGGDVAFYLRDAASGQWTKVADFADQVKQVALGFDGNLYARSTAGAPHGRILALPMAAPVLARARVVVPDGKDVIQNLAPAASRLYVQYMAGGPTEIRMFDFAGKELGALPADPISNNGIGVRLGGDEVLVSSVSYVSELAWYRYDPKGGRVKTTLAAPSKVSFSDAEVVREMAVSKDGTKVPINIVMRKGTKLDGNNPTILGGYGGYGLSQQPNFSEARRVWLDAGGIYVVANLRGGGEFGEEWHLAGNLAKKQNVFDDMIGAAEHLVKRGYTKPQRLAAIGGSNGGLLMGAILTQRPDLFRAVASFVGIYDMLRVELTPNGAFNVTEFGTVKDRAQFDALYAYSPYHHVKDGTRYPAVLFATGENDGRVDPYNSRKMAARMQAANPSGQPVLLRVSFDTGHGIGTSLDSRVEQDADTYAFLMEQLGVKALVAP